jgi:hypothetical protein
VAALHRAVSSQPNQRELLVVAGYGRQSLTHDESFNSDRTGILSYDFTSVDCCLTTLQPETPTPAGPPPYCSPRHRHALSTLL